jgi:hypothetical protein
MMRISAMGATHVAVDRAAEEYGHRRDLHYVRGRAGWMVIPGPRGWTVR